MARRVRWVRVAVALAIWCWDGIRVEVDMDPVARAWRRRGQTGLYNAVAVAGIAAVGMVELGLAVVAAVRRSLPVRSVFALGLAGTVLLAAPWLLWRLWEDLLLPLPRYVPSCC